MVELGACRLALMQHASHRKTARGKRPKERMLKIRKSMELSQYERKRDVDCGLFAFGADGKTG